MMRPALRSRTGLHEPRYKFKYLLISPNLDAREQISVIGKKGGVLGLLCFSPPATLGLRRVELQALDQSEVRFF